MIDHIWMLNNYFQSRKKILINIFLYSVSFTIILICCLIHYSIYADSDFDLEYTANFTNAYKTDIIVTLLVSGINKPLIFLRAQTPLSIIQISQLEIYDSEGNLISFYELNEVFYIFTGTRKKIKISYHVHPGVPARHGLQGYIDQRFAMLDGRLLFLVPHKEKNVGEASVRFNFPEDWNAVVPWEKSSDFSATADLRYDPAIAGKHLYKSLEETVLAFGKFNRREKEIGGNKILVHTYSEWDDNYEDKIAEKAFRILDYCYNHLKFKMNTDYHVIFVPRAKDGSQIFGGSWSLGQGFEMEPDDLRRWELFSHRLFHVFNSYQPYGMTFKHKRDNWFKEGTACYFEVLATEGSGIVDKNNRLEYLYDYYLRVHDYQGQLDQIVSRDHKIKDEETIEFLHYTKAPLITAMMNEKIKQLSSGEKDIMGFMAYLYKNYGCHQGAIELLKELNNYTGRDFSDFFDRYVYGNEKLELNF